MSPRGLRPSYDHSIHLIRHRPCLHGILEYWYLPPVLDWRGPDYTYGIDPMNLTHAGNKITREFVRPVLGVTAKTSP